MAVKKENPPCLSLRVLDSSVRSCCSPRFWRRTPARAAPRASLRYHWAVGQRFSQAVESRVRTGVVEVVTPLG